MAITFTNLGASANPDINSSADATSYANSSWTPPSSGLIFVFVFAVRAGPPVPNDPTISGNSLTWTGISTLTFGNNHRAKLFGANASGSTTGATTVDFGGQTQAGCEAAFAVADGVDLSGGVAAAFVQSPSASGFSSTPSVGLSSETSADNRPIAGVGFTTNSATMHRTNWTELDDQNMGGGDPFSGIETQYRGDVFETTASATLGASTNWIIIAAELKATTGGGPTALDPMGMTGFFGA